MMIYESLRSLCLLSLFMGASLSILPQGGVKRVGELVCACCLILAAVAPLKELDMDSFALENAKVYRRQQELTEGADQARRELDRLVIQREYEAYIMDKAALLGAEGLEVQVICQWSLEGLWVPYEVRLFGSPDQEAGEALETVLTAELGIPKERQLWEDGQSHEG